MARAAIHGEGRRGNGRDDARQRLTARMAWETPPRRHVTILPRIHLTRRLFVRRRKSFVSFG
jgi:hypothetical protein